MKNLITAVHGSSAALPTPYSLGKVDFDALDKFCNRLIDRGISALVPCGTTGEAPLLTPDEHHRVVARTVAAAAGRVPVIAGAAATIRPRPSTWRARRSAPAPKRCSASRRLISSRPRRA